ncbi:MAG: hypothetical protein V1775_00385 [Bacteroidota bacterium]
MGKGGGFFFLGGDFCQWIVGFQVWQNRRFLLYLLPKGAKGCRVNRTIADGGVSFGLVDPGAVVLFFGVLVFFLSPVMRKGRCTIISESSAASFGNSRHFVGPVSFFVPKKTDLATGFRMIVTRVPAVFTGAPHKP